MVVNGDYHEFEPEKLRGLMKILPEMDEVKSDGDTNECLDGVEPQMNIAKNVCETKPRRISSFLDLDFIRSIRGLRSSQTILMTKMMMCADR